MTRVEPNEVCQIFGVGGCLECISIEPRVVSQRNNFWLNFSDVCCVYLTSRRDIGRKFVTIEVEANMGDGAISQTCAGTELIGSFQ